MGKIFELFGGSLHINAWLDKGCLLYIYAPWCGLEAYLRGVTEKLFLGVQHAMKKN